MSVGFLYPPEPIKETTQYTILNYPGDSDPDDDDYELFSDGSSDSDSDTEIPSEETLALETETANIQWPNWEQKQESKGSEEKAQELLDIKELEAKEAAAAKLYDPDEVVGSITCFYELLISMGFWPTGCLKYPPHDLDISLLKGLGYTDSAIEVLQKLPFVSRGVQNWGTQIIPDTEFVDYTEQGELLTARHPDRAWNHFDNVHIREEWKGFVVDGKMVPLAWQGHRDGEVLVLDTETGFLRNYSFMGGPPQHTLEYKRFGLESPDRHLEGPTDFRRCRFITAVDWFRNAVHNYRSLRFLPFVELEAEDLQPLYPHLRIEERETTRHDLERRAKISILRALYKECGWDTPIWNRAVFVKKWERAKLLIKRREFDCERIWCSCSDDEERKTLLSPEEYVITEKEALRDDRRKQDTKEMFQGMKDEITYNRDSGAEKTEKMKTLEERISKERKRQDERIQMLDQRIEKIDSRIAALETEVQRLEELAGDVVLEPEFVPRELCLEARHLDMAARRRMHYLEFFETWGVRR